ncbi:MAG TPA: 4-hydroxybenzoate octaprenyltransferase [Steroidobacteraceae bacterium]|nr:4-hydroxybenzoate octaprenyltransferase [Steroidobacteraceae bacterium]
MGNTLREYALLVRLHRPIGIWLLLWPTLWALWIATAGHPSENIFLIFVGGTALMRSAGCAINDYADRDFDPHVKRTRDRPLAARRISPYEAIGVFVVLAIAALALALQLNRYAQMLAVIGCAIAVSYPFVKRFFALPQFYLGAAFSWGVPMAFAAELGGVPKIGWVIFFTTILWVAVYDTLYAMVDREDDLRIGVHSTAILFGDMDRVIIAVMQLMVLFGLCLAGRELRLGFWYGLGLAAGAIFFLYQQILIRKREPDRCFRAFLNNNYFGMAVFIGLALDYQFGH